MSNQGRIVKKETRYMSLDMNAPASSTFQIGRFGTYTRVRL